jgi:hypothetical protein
MASEPAVPLEAAEEIPPVVTNPLQQAFGGTSGVKEPILGATTQAMAGITEEL